MTNFGGVDVVPLLGAIVVCYGGGRGGGAIAGCQCSVLDGRRPTLREWTWCHCRVPISVSYFFLFSGPPISPRHPRKQQ